MGVHAEASTVTDRHVVALRDVRVHDVLQCGGLHSVHDVTILHEHCITLRMESGHVLTCTPEQMLRSPTGWVCAREASELLMVGYLQHRGSLPPPRDLMCMDDASLRVAVRHLVGEELSAGQGVVLPVHSRGELLRLQYGMISRGIRAMISKRRLVIDQPDAARYASIIGCVRPSLQAFLEAGAHLHLQPVALHAQSEIARLFGLQGLGGLTNKPAEVHELQELSSLAIARELAVSDCTRALELLEKFAMVGDVLLRSMLKTMLREQAAGNYVVRVASRVNSGRLNVVNVRGTCYLADGLTCRDDG